MVRSTPAHGHVVASLFIAAGLLWAATGCGRIIATAVYMFKGTAEPAEYAGLEDQRVVVVCRPPTSLEFRHAGASRDLAKRVGRLLAMHVSEDTLFGVLWKVEVMNLQWGQRIPLKPKNHITQSFSFRPV